MDDAVFHPLYRSGDGAPSPFRTEVSIAADSRRLAARFRSEFRVLSPAGAAHDDDLWEGDVVELFVAPIAQDRRVYYEIEVNPDGFVFDARVESPDLDRRTMRVDRGWNPAGLRVRSRVLGPDGLSGGGAGSGLWLVRIALEWSAVDRDGPTPVAIGAFRIDRRSAPEPLFLALFPNGETPANFHTPADFRVFGPATRIPAPSARARRGLLPPRWEFW